MRELLELIKKGVPERAIVSKCAKQGCRVVLKNVPFHHIILDLDHSFFGLVDKPHSDFVFISSGEPNWAVPLELKKGSLDATEMTRQLQAGSDFVQSRIPAAHQLRFRPIGAYGGHLHKRERDQLRKARVSFRKKKYEIKLIRCGTPLCTALS